MLNNAPYFTNTSLVNISMPIATYLNHTIDCFKDYEGHNITLTLKFSNGNSISWMKYKNNYTMTFNPTLASDIRSHSIIATISDS